MRHNAGRNGGTAKTAGGRGAFLLFIRGAHTRDVLQAVVNGDGPRQGGMAFLICFVALVIVGLVAAYYLGWL
jgi:hypothetical protein